LSISYVSALLAETAQADVLAFPGHEHAEVHHLLEKPSFKPNAS
jgi:hypothetical protein